MINFLKNVVLISIILLGAVNIYSVDNFGAQGAKSDADLTLEKILIYSIQDEYLARAEYYAIMSKYGNVKPFFNIVNAEETHIKELIILFQNYGFKVPDDNAKKYVVVPENIKKALETGVQAEIDNIAMYDLFLKKSLPKDVRDVFLNLEKGSESHLSAFRNNLKKY